ncbi:MAG: protein kinase domain-containing protein, partial [Anaerolineales bacterium]
VMDFIEGEDLHQRIEKQGTITETEAVQIGIAICDALIYLGERTNPIVHRDIKPGNIKITPSGEIYLVDFGLAKIVQPDQLTTTAARAMTPGYSPPEQYGTARTDPRSDIYSLGATLYAAVCGKIPEDGLARLMGQLELTPLRKRNPQISDVFAKCIEKSLEVKPEDRYSNAKEFKQALLEIQDNAHRYSKEILTSSDDEKQNHSVDQSEQDVHRYPKKDFETFENAQSNKINFPKLGIVFGLLLIGISVGWWVYASLFNHPIKGDRIVQTVAPTAPYYSTQNPNVLAILPSVTKTAPPLNDQHKPTVTLDLRPTVGSTKALAINNATETPMGGGVGQIAFASDMNGTTQIYLMNLDGRGLFQVTNMAEGACQPDFSPDGTRIVFISPCMNNRELYPSAGMFIINIDGTNLVPLPSVPGGDFDPAWAPDGNAILFTSLRIVHRPRIYRMDLTTFEVHMLSEPYGVDYQATWSPDGKRIVYVSRKLGPTDIWIMNADGSEPKRVTLSG